MAKGRGIFITLEGGEGSGKSTQVRALSEVLGKQMGLDVATTREPGGTPEAEKVRNLLVRNDGGAWAPEAEVLLLFAARQMHVRDMIRPALAEGKIVICDRFTDSTRAYQCYGHGVDEDLVDELDQLVLGGFRPDLTFILDLSVEEGLARAQKRIADDGLGEDRFERLGKEFHSRLQWGFIEIAKNNPERCVIIDAAKPEEEITQEIMRKTLEKLNAL